MTFSTQSAKCKNEERKPFRPKHRFLGKIKVQYLLSRNEVKHTQEKLLGKYQVSDFKKCLKFQQNVFLKIEKFSHTKAFALSN